jgi:hypothetical protein
MNLFSKKNDDLVNYVNPKYYNILTKTVIITGIGLISVSFFRELINQVLLQYGIKLFGEYDQLYGLLLITIGLIYNFSSQYIVNKKIDNNRHTSTSQKFKCISGLNFLAMCQTIIPILDENKYIFKTFGPNSNASATDELRTDLTLWYKSRKEIILPNNELLNCIIEKNNDAIPNEYKDVFFQLKSHIYAFKKHVTNPNFDYTQYQFPKQIEILTKTYAYELNIADDAFTKIINWLSYKLYTGLIEEIHVIGSFLFSNNLNSDVDIVLKLNTHYTSDLLRVRGVVESVKYKFKIKYSKELHVTVFTLSEDDEYREFLIKNSFRYKFHGKRPSLFNIKFLN